MANINSNRANSSMQYYAASGNSRTLGIITIYYCMTGRAIQRNIPFEIDRIGPTKGRDDTEVENGIFPVLPDPRNCNNRFII